MKLILGSDFFSVVKFLWCQLSANRKINFVLLILLMLISAFAEVISLGAVLPFLGILVAPEQALKNKWIFELATSLEITAANQLVLPLTIAFIVAALIAGFIRIILLWLSTKLVFATGAELSLEAYRRTLYQPYQVHVSRNSSSILSGIGKMNAAVSFISQLLTIISSLVVIIFIVAALITIDPIIALVAASGLGVSYSLIIILSRRRLKHNSQNIAEALVQVIKSQQEGLGGIRDVLLDGTQSIYCEIYRKADQQLRRAQGNNSVIGQSPRYAMEAIGMVLIAILAYALSLKEGGVATALPVLGALALGAQRLLPALQQLYSAWANIAGSHASLVDAIKLLDQPISPEMLAQVYEPLIFKDAIRLENLRFRYTSDGPWVLNGLSLEIPKGARVGFVGTTGSGKSTVIDLLMGLLPPTEGKMLIDGNVIGNKLIKAWQKNIAHVPQSIYLADASVAENIAFGIPLEKIDLKRVMDAANQAQIADFIESIPKGYMAEVGERGIRLSGGQRQRIGIARALYKNADILVFDEATSALDSSTERSVMQAIENLSNKQTILIIAHRITTVRHCDIIIEMAKGKVVAQGTYFELLEHSQSFRKMVSST